MVTKQELQDLALLAKLELSPDQIDELLSDMEQIIAFADKVNAAVDSGEAFDDINHLSNVYREDEVRPSYPREQILQNAKTQEDGCFFLPGRE